MALASPSSATEAAPGDSAGISGALAAHGSAESTAADAGLPSARAAAAELLTQIARDGFALVAFPRGALPGQRDNSTTSDSHEHGHVASVAMAPQPQQRSPAALLLAQAHASSVAFFAQPAKAKRPCRAGINYRFVGFSEQGARQWWQQRPFARPIPYPKPVPALACGDARVQPGSGTDARPGLQPLAAHEAASGKAGQDAQPAGAIVPNGAGLPSAAADVSEKGLAGPASAVTTNGQAVSQLPAAPGLDTMAFERSMIGLWEMCNDAALVCLAGLAAALASPQLGEAGGAAGPGDTVAARYFAWLLGLLDPPGHLPWLPQPPSVAPAASASPAAPAPLPAAADPDATSAPGEPSSAAPEAVPGRGDNSPGPLEAVGSSVLRVYQYLRCRALLQPSPRCLPFASSCSSCHPSYRPVFPMQAARLPAARPR
jgi:hypothetical protein